MILNPAIQNLDLLAVGVAVAAITVLGFVVFLANRRSATNTAFFVFALLTVAYGITNYLSYQPHAPSLVLWFLRLTIFFAVWHAFSIFHFFYVFPAAAAVYSRFYKLVLLPLAIAASAATISPFVFPGIQELPGAGGGSRALLGPLTPLFGFTAAALVITAVAMLLKKTFRSSGMERRQYDFILFGTVVTFSLIILFNLVFPVVRKDVSYIPLAPVFMLPFIVASAYAIMRYRFLDVKVIATEVMTFLIAVVMLFEVILTSDPLVLLFRFGVFLFVLAFGILLIRSVWREVEQRVELERLTLELRAANMKLADASRFKTQLLSLASHQIKSPLAAIKGFASLLVDGLSGTVDEKAKATIGKMKQAADGLVALINTLLDVRKVEEGRMDYRFAKTDLVELVAGIVTELEPLATQKKLEFSFERSAPRMWVSADAQKLAQVAQNLIDNAIKYTSRGFVKISLRIEGGAAMFTVRDSGLGVPPDLLPHLFEEFIRDERVRNEIMGTGLGLYIARKIVEAHGGRIWAESKGANQGSAFSFALKILRG